MKIRQTRRGSRIVELRKRFFFLKLTYVFFRHFQKLSLVVMEIRIHHTGWCAELDYYALSARSKVRCTLDGHFFLLFFVSFVVAMRVPFGWWHPRFFG